MQNPAFRASHVSYPPPVPTIPGLLRARRPLPHHRSARSSHRVAARSAEAPPRPRSRPQGLRLLKQEGNAAPGSAPRSRSEGETEKREGAQEVAEVEDEHDRPAESRYRLRRRGGLQVRVQGAEPHGEAEIAHPMETTAASRPRAASAGRRASGPSRARRSVIPDMNVAQSKELLPEDPPCPERTRPQEPETRELDAHQEEEAAAQPREREAERGEVEDEEEVSPGSLSRSYGIARRLRR